MSLHALFCFADIREASSAFVKRRRGLGLRGVFPESYPAYPWRWPEASALMMIALLRNAAMNSLKYKTELALVKAENIDITNFEQQIEDFKHAFGRNWRLASDGFEEAIKRIDEAISLESTKVALHKSTRQRPPGLPSWSRPRLTEGKSPDRAR